MKTHHYKTQVTWTGNEGEGTTTYKAYNSNHTISSAEKYGQIQGSSDSAFMGDATRYNPEDLFLSSIAACHMLWYLHLCSVHNIVVTDYVDNATGIMEETKNGAGAFTSVTLHPTVKVAEKSMIAKANQLHEEANTMCFIANSCNFKIAHKPNTTAV